MPCLLCGRELAMFKKLTDGEFCSPDHRTEYYDNQQRLIVERLQKNAARLRAHRATLVRKEALPPFAEYLICFPEVTVSLPGIWLHLEFEASELLLSPPGLQRHDFLRSLTFLEALHLRPDFPLPTFSRRAFIKQELAFLSSPSKKPSMRLFSYSGNVGRVRGAAPVVVRPNAVNSGQPRPSEAGRLGAGVFSSFPLVPFSGVEVDGARVSAPKSMVGIPGPDPRMDSPALHGDLAPGFTGRVRTVAGPSYPPASGLSMSQRPFRFRPRAGTQDPQLAHFHLIDTLELPLQSEPIQPAFALGTSELVPVSLRRPLRTEPRGAVADTKLPLMLSGMVEHQASASKAELPIWLPDATAMVPVPAVKPIRMRPRGPVTDAGVASMHAGTPQPEIGSMSPEKPAVVGTERELFPAALPQPLRTSPHGPLSDGDLPMMRAAQLGIDNASCASAPPSLKVNIADCAPSALHRLYQMRPRGGVSDPQVASFVRPAATSEPASTHAFIGSLPTAELSSFTPIAAETLARIVPGRPVSTELTADLSQSATVEFTSAPMHGTMPASVVENCAPNMLQRLFRMRPKAGVADSQVPAFTSTVTDAAQFSGSTLFGVLPAPPVSELTPRSAEKPFTARPRGGTGRASTEDLIAAEAEAASFQPEVARGTLPAGLLADCAPNPLDRPYRMRPRAGVVDQGLAAFERLSPGTAEALLSAPVHSTLPEPVQAGLNPQSLNQLFRSKQPLGIADSVATEGTSTADGVGHAWNVPQAALAALPLIAPGDCAPLRRERAFVMRPRGPVFDHALPGFTTIDAGSASEFSGSVHPAIAGLAPRAACEPAFRDHLFRMRPRGPVACQELRTYAPISISCFELSAATPVHPSSEAIAAPDYQPAFLDRLYKARPRAGVADKTIALFAPLDVGAIEIILPDVITPSMPPVLMRQAQMSFRERPIQMRPRGPKPGGTSNFEQIEPVTEDKKKVREASRIALPIGAVGTAVLQMAGRPTMDRPVIAVAGALALQFRCSAALPSVTPVCPEVAPLSVRGIAPATEKLYRARPRSAKSRPFVLRLEPGTLEASSEIEMPSVHSLSVQLADTQAMPTQGMMATADLPYARPANLEVAIEFADAELTIETPVLRVSPEGSLNKTARQAFWNEFKYRWVGSLIEKWATLPRDMVWIGASAALLFGVFVHSQFTTHPKKLSAPVELADLSANPLPPIESAVNRNWPTIQRNIAKRAAIDIEDDFTNGLHRWEGDRNWSKSWSYDQLGGVRTGNLAVLRDSVDMQDYRLEFSGTIDRSSLGWVVRARDARNYYAVKIIQTASRPLPSYKVVRYAVIDGKEKQKTTTPLPIAGDPKTIWRVAMDVKGQFYTLMVQGYVVDFWQDSRFQSGGIGFFSPAGEHARLHKVRLSHRDDAIGKMLALVSPDAGKKN